jgi:hypothetical protein
MVRQPGLARGKDMKCPTAHPIVEAIILVFTQMLDRMDMQFLRNPGCRREDGFPAIPQPLLTH